MRTQIIGVKHSTEKQIKTLLFRFLFDNYILQLNLELKINIEILIFQKNKSIKTQSLEIIESVIDMKKQEKLNHFSNANNQFNIKDVSRVDSKNNVNENIQTKQNDDILIRTDIFLIRIKVDKINLDNVYDQKLAQQLESLLKAYQTDERQSLLIQINSYIERKQKYGDLSFSTLETTHSYINKNQYKNEFPNHGFMEDIELKRQNNVKNSQLTKNQHKTNNKKLNVKNNKINSLDLPKKQQKNEQLGAFQLQKSEFDQKVLLKSDNKNLPTLNYIRTYQQNYKFNYKRQLKTTIQNAKELVASSMQKSIDQNRPSLKSESKLIQTRLNLNDIFVSNNSLVFTVTKDAVVEIKFKELNLLSVKKIIQNKDHQNKIFEKPESNIYWGKFPLKQFISVPFTHHQVNLQMYCRPYNPNHQKQVDIENNKSKSTINFKIFVVPGDVSWGILHISQINISHWMRSNNENKMVSLHIQFPDVHELNKLSKIKEISKLQFKVLSLLPQQKPRWTDKIDLLINPKRSRIKIKFVEMIEMKQTETMNFSVLGQSTIDLLESGFLFDGRQQTKNVWLKNLMKFDDQTRQEKIADLNLVFSFEMSHSVSRIANI